MVKKKKIIILIIERLGKQKVCFQILIELEKKACLKWQRAVWNNWFHQKYRFL